MPKDEEPDDNDLSDEEVMKMYEEGQIVELSTINERLIELPNYQPLPERKKTDPAAIARRKRAKAARKKNR